MDHGKTSTGHVITGYWCQTCSVVPVTKDGLTCSACWERDYNEYKKLLHFRAYSRPLIKTDNYIPQSLYDYRKTS